MKYSYYVIDDLRLGYDPKGVTGWRFCSFLSFEAAIKHYSNLPLSVVKEFGLTNGEDRIGIVRCVRLFPDDISGEDVLMTEAFKHPVWREEPMLVDIGREAVDALGIRYCLDDNRIIPAPKSETKHATDKFLWPDKPGDYKSAIKWIYVAGVGWVSPAEFERRYSVTGRDYRYPLVLKFKVDTFTRKGRYKFSEVTPWAYHQLEQNTKELKEQKEKNGR